MSDIYSTLTDRDLDLKKPLEESSTPYVDAFGVTQQVVADYTGASYPVANMPSPSAKVAPFQFKNWRQPGLGIVGGAGRSKKDIIYNQDTPLDGVQKTIGRQGEVNANEVIPGDSAYTKYRVAAQGSALNSMVASTWRGLMQDDLPPDPNWTVADNQRKFKELQAKGLLSQYTDRDQERMLLATSEADFNREADLNEKQYRREDASSQSIAGLILGGVVDDIAIGLATAGGGSVLNLANKLRAGSKAATFASRTRKAEKVVNEVVKESAKQTAKQAYKGGSDAVNKALALRNGTSSTTPKLALPSPGFARTTTPNVLPDYPSFTAAITAQVAKGEVVAKAAEAVKLADTVATKSLTKSQLAQAKKAQVKAKKAISTRSKKYPQVDELEETVRDTYGVTTINKGTSVESQIISHPRLWKKSIADNIDDVLDEGLDNDFVDGFWQFKGHDIIPTSKQGTKLSVPTPKTYSKIPYADGAPIKNFKISPRQAALAAVIAQAAGSSYAYSKNELRMEDVIANIIGSLANPALYKGLKGAKPKVTDTPKTGTGIVVHEAFKDVPKAKRYKFIDTLLKLGYTKKAKSTEGVRVVTGALESDAKLGYTPKSRTPDVMDVDWEEVVKDYSVLGQAKKAYAALGDYTKAVKETTDLSDLVYNGKTGYNLIVQSVEGDFFGGIQFPKPIVPSKEMLRNTADGGQEWVFPDKPPQRVWQTPSDWVDLEGMPYTANIPPLSEELLAITSKPEWQAKTVRPTVDSVLKDVETTVDKLNTGGLTHEEFTALVAHRDSLITSLPKEYRESIPELMEDATTGFVEYKPVDTVLKEVDTGVDTAGDVKKTTKKPSTTSNTQSTPKTTPKTTKPKVDAVDKEFTKDIKAREKAIADLTKFVESKVKAKDRLKDPVKIAKVLAEIVEAKANLTKAKRNLSSKLARVSKKVVSGESATLKGLSDEELSKLSGKDRERYTKAVNAVQTAKKYVDMRVAPTLQGLKDELSTATDIYKIAALKRQIIAAEKNPVKFEQSAKKELVKAEGLNTTRLKQKVEALTKLVGNLKPVED